MLQVLEKNQQAFNQLVRRWKHPLVNYFYRQLGEVERAEELAQEVFVKVWKTKKYQAQARFSTWLYRLAYHLLVDHWRSQGRRPTQFEPLEDTALELPSPAAGPEQLTLQAETRQHLQAALATLPAQQRQILVLSKFEDLKYSQIAEIVGCPDNQVKVQVFRAVQNLGKKLKELIR